MSRGSLIVPHAFEGNYVLGFVKGLAANGVSLTTLSDDDIAPQLATAGIAHENIRGSTDPRRSKGAKLRGLLGYYIRLLATIVRFRGRTIHFCGLLNSRMILIDGIVLPLWLQLWAGRYVHTAHNALPHGREHSRFFRLMYRWIYRFPHVILAHTDKLAQQLASDFGVARERIAVISIGLNEEVQETPLSRAEARRRLGLAVEGRVALFFGKIEPYKGVDLLPEAWGRLADRTARLVIAGWASDSGYARQVRAAIAASPAADRIEFREGFVPNDDVALLLKASDVVVMPYRHIYQSGVVFLCLRFGVPIVATNVGSLADYLGAHGGVVAASTSPADFAVALDRFLAAPERFPREAILRHAAAYRWDAQCRAIRSLYD